MEGPFMTIANIELPPTPTVDDALSRLQAELDALPHPDDVTPRDLPAYAARQSTLVARIDILRRAPRELADAEAQLPVLTKQRDHLVAWRQQLCDELLAMPPRIRDAMTLGRVQSIKLSLVAIDRGRVPSDAMVTLGQTRLGALMRESGVVGWFGSLPDVERKITLLTQRKNEAAAQLADALLDDDARAAKAAERAKYVAEMNARPQRKTRGDGSQYDKYPDGRVVEVEVTS
jgi:hypothetical protein